MARKPRTKATIPPVADEMPAPEKKAPRQRKPRPQLQPGEAVRRGAQARIELERTEEAFEAVRLGLFDAFCKTKIGEADARERIYAAMSVLDAVKNALTGFVNAGVMAEHEAAMNNIVRLRTA